MNTASLEDAYERLVLLSTTKENVKVLLYNKPLRECPVWRSGPDRLRIIAMTELGDEAIYLDQCQIASYARSRSVSELQRGSA